MLQNAMSEQQAIHDAMAAVSAAAVVYESRWRVRSLGTVDPQLYKRFTTQRSSYEHALALGAVAEIRLQAGAMVRGWQAAVRAMEQAQAPDDAYQLGHDPVTGLTIAISEQLAASARVRQLHGDTVAWFTPDELATLVGGLQLLGKVKQVFPDAELIELHPAEPGAEPGAAAREAAGKAPIGKA